VLHIVFQHCWSVVEVGTLELYHVHTVQQCHKRLAIEVRLWHSKCLFCSKYRKTKVQNCSSDSSDIFFTAFIPYPCQPMLLL
jgi:hypothetical protein